MMDRNDEWLSAQDDMVDLPPSKADMDPRRVLILYSSGLFMLAVWIIYTAWKHPESRTSILLQALLFLLLAVHSRVSRRRRESLASVFSKPGLRRTVAALFPLLVLALFGLSQVVDTRRRDAEKQLADKREAWKQPVERERTIAELAGKRSADALEKYGEVIKSAGKAWEEVKTADGKVVLRTSRDAMKRLKEAGVESQRALELRLAEEARLRDLERQRPKQ